MEKLYKYLESIPRSRKKVLCLLLLSTIVIPVIVNLVFTSSAIKAFLGNQLYLFLLGVLVYTLWLALLYTFKKHDKIKWKHLSLTKQEICKGLYFGLATYLIVNVALLVKALAKGESLQFTKEFSAPSEFIVALSLFVFNIFIGAFIEEVINRVYLIPQVYKAIVTKLKYKFVSLVLAVLFTQVLFAILHLPRDLFRFNLNSDVILARQEDLFLSGIVYALVYLRTRNIIFLAMYHAFLNYKLPIFQTDSYLTTLFNLVVVFVLIFWNKILKINEPRPEVKLELVA